MRLLELSKEQEDVFFALFWLGSSSIGELAPHVGLNEEKVASILSELEKLGLVHRLEGIAPRYVASFPLESLTQASKKAADDLVSSTGALNRAISQWNETAGTIMKDASANLKAQEQEALDRIKQVITAETDKIKKFSNSQANTVANVIDLLKQSKVTFEKERDRLITEVTESLDEKSTELKNQAVNQLDEAVQQFLTEITTTVEQYKDSLPKELGEFFTTLDGSLQKVLELMQETKIQQETRVKDLSAAAENIIKEQVTSLGTTWEGHVVKSTERLEGEATSFTEKMKEQATTVQKATTQLITESHVQMSEHLDDDVTKLLEVFKQDSDSAKNSAKSLATQVQQQFHEKMEELQHQVQESLKTLIQQHSTLQQRIQATLTTLEQEYQKELNSLKEQYAQAIKSLEDDMRAELTSSGELLQQEISQQVTQLQEHLTEEKEKVIQQLTRNTNAGVTALDDKLNRVLKGWQDLEGEWQKNFDETKQVVVKELEIPDIAVSPEETPGVSIDLADGSSNTVTKLNQAALTQFQKQLQQFAKNLAALVTRANEELSKSTKALLEQLAATSKINITKYHELVTSQLSTTRDELHRNIAEFSENVSIQFTKNVTTWRSSLQELGNKMRQDIKQRVETIQGKLRELAATKHQEFETMLTTLTQRHEETKKTIQTQLEQVDQGIMNQLNLMKEKHAHLMTTLATAANNQITTNNDQVIELITKAHDTLTTTLTTRVSELKETLDRLITMLKDKHANTTDTMKTQLTNLHDNWLQGFKEVKEEVLSDTTTLIDAKLEEVKEITTKFKNDSIKHVTTTHQQFQQRITESREQLRATHEHHASAVEQLLKTLEQSLRGATKKVTEIQQSHYERGHELIITNGKKAIMDLGASLQQLSENSITPFIEQAKTLPREIMTFGSNMESFHQSLAEHVQQNVATTRQALDNAATEAVIKLQENAMSLLNVLDENSKQVQAKITELSTFLETFWSKVKAIEKPKLNTIVLAGMQSMREFLLHVLNEKTFRIVYVLSPNLKYLPLKQVVNHKKARYIRLYSYLSNADHDEVKDLLKAGVQVFNIPETDNRWKGQFVLHLAGDESLWASVDHDHPENSVGLASSSPHFVDFVSEQVIKTLFTIRTQLNPLDFGIQ